MQSVVLSQSISFIVKVTHDLDTFWRLKGPGTFPLDLHHVASLQYFSQGLVHRIHANITADTVQIFSVHRLNTVDERNAIHPIVVFSEKRSGILHAVLNRLGANVARFTCPDQNACKSGRNPSPLRTFPNK